VQLVDGLPDFAALFKAEQGFVGHVEDDHSQAFVIGGLHVVVGGDLIGEEVQDASDAPGKEFCGVEELTSDESVFRSQDGV
jgi:hypothetical protein